MSDKALEKARESADKRHAKRMSKEAKEARKATRTKYRGLGRDDALALARDKFPEVLRGAKFDGDRPAPGMKVSKQLGRGAAIAVDEKTGDKTLAVSSVPLQVSTAVGDAPVDLALLDSGTNLVLRKPLVPLRIARRGAADVAFPAEGFGLELIGEQRDAQLSDDRAFFASVRPDTDGVVTPTPLGAEISLQLRSESAPERFEFDLDLPEGATVRRAQSRDPIPGDPPKSLEIVQGDTVLGFIRPPLAYDADGMPIPSEMTAQDGRLILTVEHRDRDVAYPALVDPEVVVYGSYCQTSGYPGWAWAQFPYGGPSGFGAASADPAYGCGLYTSMPTNSTFKDGAYAHWYYRAPPNTYVYRAVFDNVRHDATWYYRPDWSCCETYSAIFHGLMNRDYNAYEQPVSFENRDRTFNGANPLWVDWEFSGGRHDFCFNPRCQTKLGPEREMNYALFGIQAQNRYNDYDIGTGSDRAFASVEYTSIFLGDNQRPWFEEVPASRDWFDDGDSQQSLSVRARDNGLGIQNVTLAGAASGNATKGPACNGDPHRSPCPVNWPVTFSYRLDEGTNELALSTRDITDNPSDEYRRTFKVDRSKPQLSTPGGSLWDARNRADDHRFEGLYNDSYVLTASASDARSGVRDVEVYMTRNGGPRESQRARGGYASGGAPLSWTMRPDEYSDGDYTVEIVVRDNVYGTAGSMDARHIDTRTFEVTIDRRGDVYRAEQFTDEPSGGGTSLARIVRETPAAPVVGAAEPSA